MTIHKYILNTGYSNRQEVYMPRGARVLCTMVQQDSVTVWAEVEPELPKYAKWFWIIGTGQPMPDVKLTYIGTVEQSPFIWHVYEEK